MTGTAQVNPVAAQVAENVRRLRRRNRLSAQELAERTAEAGYHVTRSIIANLETRRREDVSVDELVALATAFDLEPAALLKELPPACADCGDRPPRGFTCNTCGAGQPVNVRKRN